jgi:hypothetical protein
MKVSKLFVTLDGVHNKIEKDFDSDYRCTPSKSWGWNKDARFRQATLKLPNGSEITISIWDGNKKEERT